jgi:2-haloacid dehalogenase
MTDAREPLAGVKAAVFDAYGTLFDVNAAVQRYAEAVGPDAVHLSEVWRNKQLEYSWTLSLMGRYAAFWDLTVRALDYALAVHPQVDPGLRERLLDAYRDLDAYPEVPGVLAALRKRGIRTAVLTATPPWWTGPWPRRVWPTISTRSCRWTTRRCSRRIPMPTESP